MTSSNKGFCFRENFSFKTDLVYPILKITFQAPIKDFYFFEKLIKLEVALIQKIS